MRLTDWIAAVKRRMQRAETGGASLWYGEMERDLRKALAMLEFATGTLALLTDEWAATVSLEKLDAMAQEHEPWMSWTALEVRYLKAREEYEDARLAAEHAGGRLTNAVNEVNAARRAIDAAIQQLKSNPPLNTDWHTLTKSASR